MLQPKTKKLLIFYRFLSVLVLVSLLCMTGPFATADTVAYWRFEEGPTGAQVSKTTSGYTYEESVADDSGNGYELSVWDEGGAGYVYRSETAYATVPQNGATNTFSVKNSGGGPAMWTSINDSISTMTPSAFTIEVTFKLENGGYRTMVGRDSYGSNTAGDSPNAALAALYLQAMPGNALAIKFCDVSGYWHVAASVSGIFTGFDFGTDPDGTTAPWYSVAAVSDGSTLSLYLLEYGVDDDYQLIAQTDITAGGSPDTALTAGVGSEDDWTAGEWSVGRGLYDGGHADRAYGYLDEIRISDSALEPSAFLGSVDYINTAAYWRFEEGPADSPVDHGGLPDGQFYPGVEDVSGKGNHLSVFSDAATEITYRTDVPASVVQDTGADNVLSVQNENANAGLFTSSADSNPQMLDIETWQPQVFTIEASFKPESGSHRTIVGRDGQNVATQNSALAALYFQVQPDDSVAVKFADVSGYWHEAVSAAGVIHYDNGGHWYHMAAVCDGTMLRLYLNDVDASLGYQLVAETDMTASGSPDTRLVADTSSGTDWHGGGWSVGRGLFNGGHTDRLIGYIDEVRISQTALDPNQFLFYEPYYADILVTPSELVVHEENTTSGDLYFSLENLPLGEVTLTIQEQNQRGQITLDQSTLTFTTSNWNLPQPIHITAVDDQDLENAKHEVPLAVTVSSALDPDYDSLEVDPVIVKVADNECGAWGYAAGDFNMDCFVDFPDYAKFAMRWLDCSDPDQVDCTPFSGL